MKRTIVLVIAAALVMMLSACGGAAPTPTSTALPVPPTPTSTPAPLTPTPTEAASPTPLPPKLPIGPFTWDACTTEGWVAQTAAGNTATTSVEVGSVARSGCSLQLDMNLKPQDVELSKGEAWKDLGKVYDLTGRTLSCWVYAPAGASGYPQSPHGAQIFVHTADSQAEYGPWFNLVEEDWMQVTFEIGRGVYRSEGYSPANISIVGVKIGTGGQAGVEYTYQGPIYVDDCALAP